MPTERSGCSVLCRIPFECIRTLKPTKIGTMHACDCCIRSTMKLAAHGTVAMGRLRKKFVNLEFDSSTQATTAIRISHGISFGATFVIDSQNCLITRRRLCAIAMSALGCDINRSTQHLSSNYRAEDVVNEAETENLLHRDRQSQRDRNIVAQNTSPFASDTEALRLSDGLLQIAQCTLLVQTRICGLPHRKPEPVQSIVNAPLLRQSLAQLG